MKAERLTEKQLYTVQVACECLIDPWAYLEWGQPFPDPLETQILAETEDELQELADIFMEENKPHQGCLCKEYHSYEYHEYHDTYQDPLLLPINQYPTPIINHNK
jgi:hypothetical protein